MSEPAEPYRPRCMQLCCKSMLVFGEAFQEDPDFQAGMTEFWCVETSKGRGPDGGPVALDVCSNPERGCFREY